MGQFTIQQAKTNFSKLIKLVEAGEEVVITRDGEPVARLVLFDAAKQKSHGRGSWKHLQGQMPDFLEPMSEEDLRLWEGSDIDPAA